MIDSIVKQNFIKATDATDLTVQNINEIITDEYISFPLDDLTYLGANFSSIASAVSAVAQFAEKGQTLYKAYFPVAGKLAEKDGYKLGGIFNNGKIVGQARFSKVKSTAQAASGASMMFIALAIMAINKSLKEISESQKAIISFLETDKQTQLKGDLLILSEIIEEYQHNWNNSQFCSNRENQVLDIKRSAEQNLLFYKEMIEKKTKKQSFIHIDTSKTLNDIQTKFRYYKLSLYIYAFASFLDIMLLGNFDSSYLNSIIEKIKKHSEEYNLFFNSSMELVQSYISSSLQSRALQGISVAGNFTAQQIAKIPDKDNKVKIDDKLIAGSKKLKKFNENALDKTLESFSSVEDNGITLFLNKIHLINHLHNESMSILFDSENIYLPLSS